MPYAASQIRRRILRRTRVLIVDDSAIVRKILADAVSSEDDMEVVGTAPDPFVARDKILALKPDVLTLDIEMPCMDGLTFLKRIMRFHPIPTIIISSLGGASTSAALDGLRFGAVDVLAKPAGPYSVGELRHMLASRIRAAAAARPNILRSAARVAPDVCEAAPTRIGGSLLSKHPRTVLALGASTGGIVAIQDILRELPADIPGTVITQHISAGFSLAFANRLNQLCGMQVREAANGDRLERGLALVAPGNQHLLLRRDCAGYFVELRQGPEVCFQRPSVDVLFASVAQAAGSHAVGVLLTGMGTDGARGLLTLRRAGAQTIAQDEASSVVYGMPREAARLGAAATIAPLDNIPTLIRNRIQRTVRSRDAVDEVRDGSGRLDRLTARQKDRTPGETQ